MSAAQLIYYVAQSLDGYIADSDEKVEWLDGFGSEEEDYGYHSFYQSVDSLVMGSNTFRFVQNYGEWPYTGKASWIFSRKPLDKMDPQNHITSKAPAEVLKEIRAKGFGTTWLVGGGKLAKSFSEINAISKYIITVIPVILGSGLSLMADISQRVDLKMTDRTVYDSGVIQMSFIPASHL